MSTLTVDQGDVIRLYTSEPFTVWDEDADPPAYVATDPDTVALLVGKPDGTQLVYGWPSAGADGTLTQNGTGDFEQLVEVDQDGVWLYRWEGSGAAQAAEQGRFFARRPSVVLVATP